jgi:hypothetical protein
MSDIILLAVSLAFLFGLLVALPIAVVNRHTRDIGDGDRY